MPMVAGIHPTAIVADDVRIASGVQIGPYSVIGADVAIGEGTVIGAHVVIAARTTLGRRNHVFQFASLGEIPQDRKYDGRPTRTVVGDDNVIREFVTVHAGTVQDRGVTTIGDGNWLLAYSHVAHDCVVGNGTTFSNNAQLAGHVVIDDHATLGGFVGVHQFCRVGAHAFIAAGSIVLQDVPPYVTAAGYPAKPHGTNNEGLRRRGYTADDLLAIKRAYKTLYRSSLTLDEARTQIAADARSAGVLAPLAAFLETAGRGIIR
jgi:UDP-N-acetylglucosamine acyltransferase